MTHARGLRLMVYDRTCDGPRAGVPGLTTAWKTGGALYSALGRFDARTGASSWVEALDWLGSVEPTRSIEEIQFWGHGTWGRAMISRESLDASALRPGHSLHPRLERVRERLSGGGARDGLPLWWFRTCETIGRASGHAFARAWTDFFRCRIAGHTYVIGPLQSGLHSLAPGERPRWSITEGLPPGVGEPTTALPSRWGEVNTITCLRGDVPAGY